MVLLLAVSNTRLTFSLFTAIDILGGDVKYFKSKKTISGTSYLYLLQQPEWIVGGDIVSNIVSGHLLTNQRPTIHSGTTEMS